MKIEPAEQFAGKTAHALRPQGYGENVEALIAEGIRITSVSDVAGP